MPFADKATQAIRAEEVMRAIEDGVVLPARIGERTGYGTTVIRSILCRLVHSGRVVRKRRPWGPTWSYHPAFSLLQ